MEKAVFSVMELDHHSAQCINCKMLGETLDTHHYGPMHKYGYHTSQVAFVHFCYEGSIAFLIFCVGICYGVTMSWHLPPHGACKRAPNLPYLQFFHPFIQLQIYNDNF